MRRPFFRWRIYPLTTGSGRGGGGVRSGSFSSSLPWAVGLDAGEAGADAGIPTGTMTGGVAGAAGDAATPGGRAATGAAGAGAGAGATGAGAGFRPNSQSQIRWKYPRPREVKETFKRGIREPVSSRGCMSGASGTLGLLTDGAERALGVLLSLTLNLASVEAATSKMANTASAA